MSKSILSSLSEVGISRDTLWAARRSSYPKAIGSGYLLDLILDSDAVAQQANSAWDYKSLTQLGRESFSTESAVVLLASEMMAEREAIDVRDLEHAAAKLFGQGILHWVHQVPDGLRLYVAEGDGFREGTASDEHWSLLQGITKHNLSLDSRMYAPEPWANELYVSKENLKIFSAFWHDCSDMKDPMYAFSKWAKVAAIDAFHKGSLGSVPSHVLDDDAPLELRLAVSAYKAVWGDSNALKRKTPKQALIAWLKANHASLSEGAVDRISTIANWQPTGGAPKQA